MKVSYSWLKELTGISWSPDVVADKLASLGFPVESIENKGVQVNSVISVKILAISRHPNADRLQIATVTDGKEERTIVCGAPNIQVGQIVPLALPGAKLPGGIEISVSSIRGVESKGMLCSERELGLSQEHAGILELSSDTKLGKEIKDVLGGNDVVMDVEVTPNRPDMLSHVGVARELSALTQDPLRMPRSQKLKDGRKKSACPIKIEDQSRCSFYSAKIIRGVKVQPSPAWMVERLKNSGIRSINNIVDVTNYVLLECGHPLHAFDLAKLAGPEIHVRRAKEGESFSALDEKTYKLSSSDLVIGDAATPQALAGIMGGGLSGVSEQTTDILLESAVFDTVGVRQTSRRLVLRSESSIRFEKGTDIGTARLASERAAQLILELAGGTLESTSIEGKKEISLKKINLREARVEFVLGTRVASNKIQAILRQLGLNPKKNKTGWICTVPLYRHDLLEEIDLIEEIARIEGYNSFSSAAPKAAPCPQSEIFSVKNTGPLADFLKGAGLTQTITHSFSSQDHTNDFSIPSELLLTLANPISKEESVMRPLLSINLLKAVLNNQNHQRNSVQFFEFGKTFMQTNQGHEEIAGLAVILGGLTQNPTWHSKNKYIDIYHLKGLLESAFAFLKIKAEFHSFSKKAFLHTYQSFDVSIRGQKSGWGGMLHPAIAAKWGFQWPVALAEMKLDSIPFSSLRPKAVPLQKFPFVERDIAVLVEKNKLWGELLTRIKQAGGAYLIDINPFDVFEGGALGENRKSIAFRLKLQHAEHTMTDSEINGVVDKIKSTLQQHCGAQLR